MLNMAIDTSETALEEELEESRSRQPKAVTEFLASMPEIPHKMLLKKYILRSIRLVWLSRHRSTIISTQSFTKPLVGLCYANDVLKTPAYAFLLNYQGYETWQNSLSELELSQAQKLVLGEFDVYQIKDNSVVIRNQHMGVYDDLLHKLLAHLDEVKLASATDTQKVELDKIILKAPAQQPLPTIIKRGRPAKERQGPKSDYERIVAVFFKRRIVRQKALDSCCKSSDSVEKAFNKAKHVLKESHRLEVVEKQDANRESYFTTEVIR